MIPSDVNDEMRKLRESIPPGERCLSCDGFGMMMDRYLKTYRVCQQYGGTGRNKLAKSKGRT
jgi:hypothetical protein